MQLFAFDEGNNVVFASKAIKGIDYVCPECKNTVHRRGGAFRQDHFYHLEISPNCRLNGKSQEHLNVQSYFLSLLPKEQCRLEHFFPEIKRIADIFWVDKNIVFEVQCSSIDLQELIQRNIDYALLGIEVVWILHDKRFNKEKLSAIESYLHKKAHYFTNIDENGFGWVYDQFSILHKGKRLHQSDPLPIDVFSFAFYKLPLLRLFHKIPSVVLERLKERSFHFSGDIVDSYFKSFLPMLFSNVCFLEKEFYGKKSLAKKILNTIVSLTIRPYRIFLQILLERCCR